MLLAFGAAYGGMNVAINSAAVDLVAALRRPVMSGFHAAYSLGGLLGAALGGLLAPHLSPTTHLLLLTPVGLLVAAVAGRTLLTQRITPPADDQQDRSGSTGSPPKGRPAPRRPCTGPACWWPSSA